MGFFKSAFSNLKKDEDFLNEEKSRRIQKILDNREKSIHERNLEKFQESKRQEAIKKKMEEINLKQSSSSLFSSFHPDKNIFSNHKSILKTPNKVLDSKNKKGKNLFFK